ncbi:MAG: EAL domain-containing protein [Treponema sp.]|nr:EAL domain-containing protein [Treponema sp.]
MPENQNADVHSKENRGKPLVLIVDDEEINRMLLANILEARYKIETASDGQEALQKMRHYHGMISAVLLDLFMPNKNGFEVLKEMRTDDMLRHIPVIVLTGHKDAEVESFEQGAYDFITKPFEVPELILARVAKTIRLAEETYIVSTMEKDPLTNLPNMSFFKKLCRLEKQRLAKSGEKSAIVYIDLVNMKSYNSSYGYAEGDNLLINVASTLQSTFTDMPVGRISDDHFAVMVAQSRLESMLEILRTRIRSTGKGTAVEFHAGVFKEEDGQDTDIVAAVDYARIACATLRGNYNATVCYYDQKLMKKYNDRQHVLTHFDQALSEHWIKVFYQPIVRTATKEICHFEALARWIDPQRGKLSPGVFIPVIEDYNLGVRMDLYMVEEVCREYEKRKSNGIEPVPVSVNFTRTDFDQMDMVKAITEIVDKYNVPHNMIDIEVTESAFSHNPGWLQKQIDALHANGFQVWMDDFGDGYASLNVLQENTFDVIKLDMGFMRKFSPTGKNGIILTDIVAMSHRLGIHTLSEGVENEEQYEFLKKIGCERIQGFYFGKPMTIDEFLESVREGKALPIEKPADTAHFDKTYGFNLMSQLSQEMPGGIIVYTSDEKEEILFANQELITMFGCDTLSEFLEYSNNSFKTLVHPEDLARVQKTIASKIGHGESSGIDYLDYRIITKTEKVKKVEHAGHLVHDSRYGNIFCVFLSDAEKRANALAQQEVVC